MRLCISISLVSLSSLPPQSLSPVWIWTVDEAVSPAGCRLCAVVLYSDPESILPVGAEGKLEEIRKLILAEKERETYVRTHNTEHRNTQPTRTQTDAQGHTDTQTHEA